MAGSADPPRRERADRLVVAQGLAETRHKAQALILAGVIFDGPRRIDKPGQPLPAGTRLTRAADPLPYVGRGGLKLEHALARFTLEVSGITALDVGASTGGFTDCLLQRGARRVHALDVGKGQLHWRLRNDSRVVLHEGVNARHLEPGRFGEPIDLAVIDVSFISLRLVLPAVRRAAAPARCVVLVKPQFEVGRRRVEPGGLVTDPAEHRRVLREILGLAQGEGLAPRGLCASPIRGAEGNREFLLWLETGAAAPEESSVESWIGEATE